MAAVDFYLKIDGVDGESVTKGHDKEIELLSFSWGELNSGTFGMGSGGGAGKVSFQDFHFVKRLDKASPELMRRCATGQHLPKAVLTCLKPTGKGGQQVYFKVSFTDILVSSYHTGGASNDGQHVVPMDQISFNFAKIEFEYKEQKPDGSLGSAVTTSYDQKKAEQA